MNKYRHFCHASRNFSVDFRTYSRDTPHNKIYTLPRVSPSVRDIIERRLIPFGRGDPALLPFGNNIGFPIDHRRQHLITLSEY